MNPGSTRTFYQARRIVWIAALVAPVLLLGGVWWLVTEVLLPPAVPDDRTPPDEVVQFMVHEQGLPRLARAKAEQFVLAQGRRLAREAAFREQFLAALRTSSPEDKKALRTNLLDTFTPMIREDVRRFQSLSPGQREAFLDDRIVAYLRLNVFRDTHVHVKGSDAWGDAPPTQDELMTWFATRFNEEERQMVAAYFAALFARAQAVAADPELKAKFEAQLAGGG